MLAGGIGILNPSSAGSVILDMFLIMVSDFTLSFTSFSFSSEMLGVKFIIRVLREG